MRARTVSLSGLLLLALAGVGHAAPGTGNEPVMTTGRDGRVRITNLRTGAFDSTPEPKAPDFGGEPSAPIAANTPAPAPTSGGGSPALALAALDRRIADLDAEEQASKRELGELAGKLGDARGRSVSRGRSFYKLTRAGMLPVGGGFGSLVNHALKVERARHTLARDVADEGRLRQRGADLARALERVARDRVALASQRNAMDAARIAMADEVERQKAFDRAFASPSSATDGYVPVFGGGGGVQPSESNWFLASKGKLLFPVLGKADVRAARREGTDGPGLEIKTTPSAPVRAVYAGRVAFADRYGAYGRLVIVDHGEHYYTVSGNLADVSVRVGDEVPAGERLGTVADEGHGPMLYFEIRHGTQTLPPGPWLGL